VLGLGGMTPAAAAALLQGTIGIERIIEAHRCHPFCFPQRQSTRRVALCADARLVKRKQPPCQRLQAAKEKRSWLSCAGTALQDGCMLSVVAIADAQKLSTCPESVLRKIQARALSWAERRSLKSCNPRTAFAAVHESAPDTSRRLGGRLAWSAAGGEPDREPGGPARFIASGKCARSRGAAQARSRTRRKLRTRLGT
jgi:hypothetical protein